MKLNVWVMLLAAAGGFALQAARVVLSENTVGVLRVKTTTARTIVPVPFVAAGDQTTETEPAITVDQMVQKENVAWMDSIESWKGHAYDVWSLDNDVWTVNNSGTPGANTPAADKAPLTIGEGVWFSPGPNVTGEKSILAVGQLPKAASLTTTIQPGEQKLLANPLLEQPFELNRIRGAARDTILVVAGEGTKTYKYDETLQKWFLYSFDSESGKWGRTYHEQNLIPPRGGAFWYQRATGLEPLTINWLETSVGE